MHFIKPLDRRIKKFVYQFALFQSLILIASTFVSIQFLEANKNRLANAVALSVRDDVVNSDFRAVMTNAFQIVDNEFELYRFLDKKKNTSLQYPNEVMVRNFNESLFDKLFYEKISREIALTDRNLLGEFVFFYNRFEYFQYVLVFWLLVILCSVPIAMQALVGIKSDIEKELELEKEKMLNFTSKKLAHDIKQLIEPIKNDIEKINHGNQDAREFVEEAINLIEIRTLSLLGRNMQSEYESSAEVKEEYIHLKSELESTVNEFQFRLKNQKNLFVNLKIDEDELKKIFVKCNKVELRRAIINILSNSWEAMKNKLDGKIEIIVKVDRRKVKISFYDNGCGIPKKYLDKVMLENFTHGKEKGTGHGLYQVSSFVKKVNGNLQISSNVSQGTEVNFTMLVDELKYKKIIHIDDQPLIRKAWKRYFSTAGVDVSSYSSPSDYLANKDGAFENAPVFIDSNMGDDEKGEIFAERLQAEGFTKIYLSSGDCSSINISKYPWLSGAFGKRPELAVYYLV